MRIKMVPTYGQLLLAVGLMGVLGIGCSHSPVEPAYDSVVVDRSSPERTVVELNGDCAAGVAQGKNEIQGKQENVVTKDGKTYYFSSEAARDHFFQTYAINSRY